MSNRADDHATASRGFLDVAGRVTDWSAPTPCTEWNARDLFEHVVGFHEVLILQPLDVSADRPSDDPPRLLGLMGRDPSWTPPPG